ncbi:hypothetical protein WJX72_002969 [[Myrmecia] bisecta]|uniref:Uncharacterized protein n=1 Tax=[Myrmecia] bisecta TaxID=41462 RepID=A0AAW1PDD4_9CHLO
MADHIAPSLKPVYQKLTGITNDLDTLKKRGNYSSSDLEPIQDRLREVDEIYVDGKFVVGGNEVPAGQAVLAEMLNDAHGLLDDLQDALPE